MASPLGLIHNAKQTAALARVESRPDSHHIGYPVLLRFGIVSAVQGGGLYQVNFGGDPAIVANGCPVFPPAELAVDAEVIVMEFPGRLVPVIMGAGAEGSFGFFFQGFRDPGMFSLAGMIGS
jgi:hypothetical protein